MLNIADNGYIGRHRRPQPQSSPLRILVRRVLFGIPTDHPEQNCKLR